LNLISRKQIGEFTLQQISKKHYRVIYTGQANNAIPMTGAAVTKDFDIEFTFVLERLHLNHSTSTITTASQDEINLILSRPHVHGLPTFEDIFFRKEEITVSKYILSFEDLNSEGGLIFEPSTIRLSLLSTSADLIVPIFYLKRLD